MRLFEQELNDYIKHHVNPISPNSLDPRVWYFLPQGGDPKLQPGIKEQILNDINQINTLEQEGAKRVWDYIMVGPALSENSSSKCPINIIVQINTANLSDVLKEGILNTIKNLNGRLATGSLHPIYYIPTIRKFGTNDNPDYYDKTAYSDVNDKYDAIYHPFREVWIKKPRFLGEAKTDLETLNSIVPKKIRKKYPLNKGVKKLTKI